MAFHEIRLPEDISYNSQRGPEYTTVIYENDSHIEHRVSKTPKGRLRYQIIKELLTMTQIAELEAFYRARRGRFYGFRYKDWEDYQVEDEPLVWNGSDLTINLIKTYPDDINPEVRRIYKPVSPITLELDGSPFTTGFTVNYNTGVITLDSPPVGTEFTWSGEFDVPVRFDTDRMTYTRESLNIHNWNSITLVELLNV